MFTEAVSTSFVCKSSQLWSILFISDSSSNIPFRALISANTSLHCDSVAERIWTIFCCSDLIIHEMKSTVVIPLLCCCVTDSSMEDNEYIMNADDNIWSHNYNLQFQKLFLIFCKQNKKDRQTSFYVPTSNCSCHLSVEYKMVLLCCNYFPTKQWIFYKKNIGSIRGKNCIEAGSYYCNTIYKILYCSA